MSSSFCSGCSWTELECWANLRFCLFVSGVTEHSSTHWKAHLYIAIMVWTLLPSSTQATDYTRLHSLGYKQWVHQTTSPQFAAWTLSVPNHAYRLSQSTASSFHKQIQWYHNMWVKQTTVWITEFLQCSFLLHIRGTILHKSKSSKELPFVTLHSTQG